MVTAKLPDITTMTLEEARAYIIENLDLNSDSHHIEIDAIATTLLMEANDSRGDQTRHHPGSLSGYPDAKYTAVLYDAAWALVCEGILRPGPSCVGAPNQRCNGFCLTGLGREKIGLKA